MIGAFTLSILLSGFLFVLWFAGSEIDRDFDEYDIIFDSAVTGLSEGGDVRYSGIKIGEVTRLRLNPQKPSQVIARVRVAAETPVYADTSARLEIQGLTGVAFILITSAEDSERVRIVKPDDNDVPILHGEPSALQELVMTAPGLIEGATSVLTQLQLILNDENRKNIALTLSNLEEMSSSLEGRSEQIGQIVDNFSTISNDLASTSGEISTAATELSELSITANKLLSEDGTLLMKDGRAAILSIKALSDNANSMLENNAGAIQSFSDDGLSQIGPFMKDASKTLASIDRILQRMESDPARYISGNYGTEYEPEAR